MRFQRRGEPQVQGSNASSSSSSIEVRETSLITEDIELIEQSHTDTIEVSCIFRNFSSKQHDDRLQIDLMVKSGKWTGKYCQAIQQDTDEDVKSALFADLRLPLPNNLAGENMCTAA